MTFDTRRTERFFQVVHRHVCPIVTIERRLILTRSLPVTTKKWTDHGDRHDQRGLKQRDPDAVRSGPVPPWLVQILRAHIEEFGTAPDGRLFRNERGGIVGSTTYSRVWEEARQLAFTPAQAASPLAGRPLRSAPRRPLYMAQRRNPGRRSGQARRKLRGGPAPAVRGLSGQLG